MKKKPMKVRMVDHHGKQFEMDLTVTRPGKFTLTNVKEVKEKKPSIPEAGQFKFFVLCERVTLYTTIGADNVHHASNKATKLFGPNWSMVTVEPYHCRGYEFISVAAFNKIVRTLPN